MTGGFRYRMELEYFGAGFHGWQKQKDQVTVQGTLEEKIAVLLREKTAVRGSGRTDAGVHALKQVADFKASQELDPGLFIYQLNSITPDDVSILKVEPAPADFDARRSAKAREYTYFILNRPAPSPFFLKTAYHHPFPLDKEKMREAAALMVGRHDFYSFCLKDKKELSTARNVLLIELETERDWIKLRIRADAFLYRMVRITGGMLVKIGAGELPVSAVSEHLEKRKKFSAFILPPEGLFLTDVFY